jgi:hypothetical protein
MIPSHKLYTHLLFFNTAWYAPVIGLRWFIYPYIFPEWLASIDGNTTAFIFFIFAMFSCLSYKKTFSTSLSFFMFVFAFLCGFQQTTYLIEDLQAVVYDPNIGTGFLLCVGFLFWLFYVFSLMRFYPNAFLQAKAN